MENYDPNKDASANQAANTPGTSDSPTESPSHRGRQLPQLPTTVVVRSSVVPMILMVILCAFLGVCLIGSIIFNIYTAAAYAQYFPTDTETLESFHSGERTATKKIAIISVSGVMLQSNGFAKRQIDRVRKDENVEAIVLRINSPGGAVTAADYLYHHLGELRDEKDVPIVVSMGSVAASGGYYVAMAASDDERVIFCEPTGITGSIGVIIPRYDISELLKEYNVKSDSIVSHPLKELGSWTNEMTPEERMRLQSQVDLLFNRFKDIIREGRPQFANDEDALTQVATGEVFTGLQAKELMLVDDVGFIEDAIERAAELAKLDSDEYRVVQYNRPATLADALTGSIESQQNPAQQVFEMTTPRAYYLYSGLPGFVPQ